MRHLTVLLLPVVVSMIACSADESGPDGPLSDGDRLFATQASPDADATQLDGIWESKTPREQSGLESRIRLELRADHVVAAVRCTPTAGGDATVLGKVGAATVSSTTIQVPDEVRVSKTIGASYCGVVLRAGTLPTCDLRVPVTERKSCFELAKGTLTVRDDVTSVEYVKLAN